MKSLNFAVFILLLTIQTTLSAQSFTAISNAQGLAWFGLDFTRAKMVGEFSGPITCSNGYMVTTMDGSGVSPELIRDNLFTGWNNVVLNEPDKYDLKKFLGNKVISNIVQPVMKLNALVNADSIKIMGSYNSAPFSHEKLQQIIDNYKPLIPQSFEGIGVTVIIEKFDRITKTAIFDVVFFDIKSCKLIFADQISGVPEGWACGLRNYWAGSIYDLLKTIKGKKWSKWKKVI